MAVNSLLSLAIVAAACAAGAMSPVSVQDGSGALFMVSLIVLMCGAGVLWIRDFYSWEPWIKMASTRTLAVFAAASVLLLAHFANQSARGLWSLRSNPWLELYFAIKLLTMTYGMNFIFLERVRKNKDSRTAVRKLQYLRMGERNIA